MAADFHTITGADWKRSLRAARSRRVRESARVREQIKAALKAVKP